MTVVLQVGLVGGAHGGGAAAETVSARDAQIRRQRANLLHVTAQKV